MNSQLYVIALCFILTLAACAPTAKQQTQKNETVKVSSKPPMGGPEIKWQSGEVKFINLEGGFFGIVTAKGQKLLPTNLARKYQKDGLKINFSGFIDKDVMTINQWGNSYKIVEISRVK